MENKINGLLSNPMRPLEPRQGVRPAEADTASPSRSGADQVNVTDSARSIQQSERAQTVAPAVDAGRVAAIRQELSEGRFTVSPTRIADNLLALEQQFAGAG